MAHMHANQPKPRRWFRFSLRTLLIFVTLFCGLLSWGIVQWKWYHDRYDAMQGLLQARKPVSASSTPTRASRLGLSFFGVRAYDKIHWVRLDDSDTAIERKLRRVFPEAEVSSMSEIEFLERNPWYDNGRRVKSFNPTVYSDGNP